MSLTIKTRTAWEDRFRTPEADELFIDLDKIKLSAVDATRSALTALPDVSERLEWLGLPWRWAFVYTRGDEQPPLAYLVPQTGRPQLVIPMPEDVILGLTGKRIAKTLRDGLIFANEVSGIRWPQWELTSKSQAEELLTLVKLRVRPAPAAH